MTFRITGLQPDLFKHLFGRPDDDLRKHGVTRCVVDATPGFPDRIELRDALPGETVLLLNYTHLPADNPYRACHAIFVREGARAAYDAIDQVPEVIRMRMMSLRSFDAADMMTDADLVDGKEIERVIKRMFLDPRVAYLQAHYAKRGCYAARIDRA